MSEENKDLYAEQPLNDLNDSNDNMEVHQHPHHAKKNWKSYFWEFLMLFLAVFCGFLAENQREHMVEHKRENKFAKRILADLKEDSAFLIRRIDSLEIRKKRYRDFLSLMTGARKASDLEITSTYFLLLKSYKPQFTTTTYSQMKSSGSLRLVENDSLTTTLQKYYEIVIPRASVDAEAIDRFFADYVVPYMIRHFRFQKMTDSTTAITEPESVIFARTAESDQEFINIMSAYQAGCDEILKQQMSALLKCKELNELIKKEYHLK